MTLVTTPIIVGIILLYRQVLGQDKKYSPQELIEKIGVAAPPYDYAHLITVPAWLCMQIG